MLSARTCDVVGCATSPLVVANAENAHSQGKEYRRFQSPTHWAGRLPEVKRTISGHPLHDYMVSFKAYSESSGPRCFTGKSVHGLRIRLLG